MQTDYIYDCTRRFAHSYGLISFRFTGKERDTESGNDYFEARYYSSAMGRFMSPDWSAKIAPVPHAKLGGYRRRGWYVWIEHSDRARSGRGQEDAGSGMPTSTEEMQSMNVTCRRLRRFNLLTAQ